MRVKRRRRAPDPRHVRWLDKWGDPTEGFTRDLFGDPAFESPEAARAAWPAVRRAVWGNLHRFRVPSAAELFDEITFESCRHGARRVVSGRLPARCGARGARRGSAAPGRLPGARSRGRCDDCRLPRAVRGGSARWSKRPRGRWRRSRGRRSGARIRSIWAPRQPTAAAPKRRECGRTCHPSPPPPIVAAASSQTLAALGGLRRARGGRRAPALSDAAADGRTRAALERILPALAAALGSELFLAQRSRHASENAGARPGARRHERAATGAAAAPWLTAWRWLATWSRASGTEAGAVLWCIYRVGVLSFVPVRSRPHPSRLRHMNV